IDQQYLSQRARRAGRTNSLGPTHLQIARTYGPNLAGGRQLGPVQGILGNSAVRKIASAEADTAHIQALPFNRLQPLTDDEFGGATTDIDHQPPVIDGRQTVTDTNKNHTRF